MIGLTGGIGAGKSTIAQRLREHGAIVFDADQVARDAVASGTKALAEIRRVFGEEVLDASGALNRQRLAEIVFTDNAKLAELNDIVHPAVRKLTRALLDNVAAEHPDAVVVYDVPLLIEANVDHGWDLIVVAMADDETRAQRLRDERGMDASEAQQRIASQASDDQRRAIADVIIRTDGTLEETLQQTDKFWESVKVAQQRKA